MFCRFQWSRVLAIFLVLRQHTSQKLHFCSVGYSHSWRGASGCRRGACLCLTHRPLLCSPDPGPQLGWSFTPPSTQSINPPQSSPDVPLQGYSRFCQVDSQCYPPQREVFCFFFFSVKIKTSRKKYTLDYVLEKI